MTNTQLSVYWTHGEGAEDDEDRALAAARAVFSEYGADPADCQDAYRKWAAADEDADCPADLALVWSEAEAAANLAATAGWHDPDGAYVEIRAVRL